MQSQDAQIKQLQEQLQMERAARIEAERIASNSIGVATRLKDDNARLQAELKNVKDAVALLSTRYFGVPIDVSTLVCMPVGCIQLLAERHAMTSGIRCKPFVECM